MNFIIALLAILAGAIACFAGYRLFLILLPIWGFFAGLWLGGVALAEVLGGGFLATTTGIVVGVVLGIIFAVLAYLFYIIGVAILAGTIGYWIAVGILQAIGIDGQLILLVVGVIGAIVAVGVTLLLNLQKYVVIAITALGGASLAFFGVLALFGQINIEDQSWSLGVLAPYLQGNWLFALIALVLVVAGFIVQLQTTRGYVLDTSKRAF